MTSIAFVGLGIMGHPMAVNLQRAGFELIGHTRSETSRRRARAAGLTVVDRLQDLPRTVDAVITMLPDGPDVRGVLLGDDGLAAHLDEPALVIDMSTIAPEDARTVASELSAQGHHVLDAPVSGGEAGAVEGVLSIMVGGAPEDVERARPMFDPIGRTIVHVGPHGAGQVVKAANQIVVAGNLQMLAEAIVLVEAHGVDPTAALSVLAGGLAGSTALERKRQALLERNFRPGFRLELHHKDLGIATSAARAAGVALPVTAVVSQLVQALVARGDGGLDHSALLKLTSELSPSPRR